MKTVAAVISVSRSNLADRLQERLKKRIGRPPLPDEELVSKIKAVIAELATYGCRRVHAGFKRQARAAGLKPPHLRQPPPTENHAAPKTTQQWNGGTPRPHHQPRLCPA